MYTFLLALLFLSLLFLLVYVFYLKRSIDRKVEARIEDKEDEIRKDAVDRSRSVLKGKISEHMAPFTDDFDYQASDARFLGSPVDYVIFDGYSEDAEDIKVVIGDVKTGDSSDLTAVQKKIKKALEKGNIKWETFRIEG